MPARAEESPEKSLSVFFYVYTIMFTSPLPSIQSSAYYLQLP